jgi:Tfp pilus assembly protein PilV
MISTNRLARGVSLVEALVALAIMAFGMMAYVGVQNTLRLNGDVARQRSEATRIAQEALDSLRLFTVVESTPGQQAWADIASSPAPQTIAGLSTNTNFVLARSVDTSSAALKTLSVSVTWEDRAGQTQQVVLSSVIAAVAPGLSGALAVKPATSPVRLPRTRHPTIPLVAHELDSGRSVFRPDPHVGWVFNNVTGIITGICELQPEVSTASLTAAALSQCSNNTLAQFVSGVIRFNLSSDVAPLTAIDAENPTGPALNLDVGLTLTSSGHPSGAVCFDDAPTTLVGSTQMAFVTYNCVVPSNASQLWSGRTEVVPLAFVDSADSGWQIANSDPGATGRVFKVCRYTPTDAADSSVANVDHPARYTLVAGNLIHQNFLVIRATKTCPTDVAANPAVGDFVNTNTVQHQPEPI